MPYATVTNTVDCNPPHLSFASSAPKLACSDTGSTNLLVRQSDASAVIIDSHLQPISVTLPNGSTISSSCSGTLLFPNLPYPIKAYIFPDRVLHTSLLSVSELCNVGCLATFTNTTFHVTYNNSTVLHGVKATTDTLWTFFRLLPLDQQRQKRGAMDGRDAKRCMRAVWHDRHVLQHRREPLHTCKTKYKMSPSSVRSEGGEAAAGYCLNSVSYRVDEAVKYNVLNSD